MGVLSAEGGLEMGIKDPTSWPKPCCAAAYLRGAFLGSGFISNPKSDFHFEITVESEALAEGHRGAAWPATDITRPHHGSGAAPTWST